MSQSNNRRARRHGKLPPQTLTPEALPLPIPQKDPGGIILPPGYQRPSNPEAVATISAKLASGPLPGSAAEAAKMLQDAINEYELEQRRNPDPMKAVAAGAINRMEAQQHSKEAAQLIEAQGLEAQPVTPELLLEMQEWAFQYKQRNPLASQELVMRTACEKFGIQIIDETPTPPEV